MNDKLVKENGEVFHRSTYSDLADSDIHNLVQISTRENFDRNIAERYGPNAMYEFFCEISLEGNPYFDLYEDNNGGDMPVGLDEEENPTHGIGIDWDVSTPEADSFDRGKVIGQNVYNNFNSTGQANINSILGTHEY